MRPAVGLVTAKAPVAGLVKTRLGREVGMEVAADLAAAALLDTLEGVARAFGPECCHLALDGDLAVAARAADLLAATEGWTVHPQVGDGFAERLVRAHADAGATGAPVVQVGMDTPHLDSDALVEAAALVRGPQDAVIGPADDGGWWLLAVAGPHLVAHLDTVPMSTSRTGEQTREALARAGALVRDVAPMRDVDEVEDAEAAAQAAPHTRFARAWRATQDRRRP